MKNKGSFNAKIDLLSDTSQWDMRFILRQLSDTKRRVLLNRGFHPVAASLMHFLICITLLALQFISESAFANSNEFRLDTNGRSMVGATVFNQANQGTCYAYVAASYLEALIRRDFKQTFVPSPMSLAYEYKNYRLSKILPAQRTQADYSLDSGVVLSALSIAKLQGVCPRASFNDSLLSVGNYDEATSTAQALYWPLEYLFGLAKTQLKDYSLLKERAQSSKSKLTEVEHELDATVELIRKYISTNGVSETYQPTAEELYRKIEESSHPFYSIYGLMKSSCRGQELAVKLPDFEVRKISIANPISKDGVFSHFNTEMEKKNLPVVVAYCTEVIKDRSFKRVKANCSAHVSLVMGHKVFNKKRFYLVQNSWGTNCKGIRHCDPTTGRFWIEETDLYDNMFDYYITR